MAATAPADHGDATPAPNPRSRRKSDRRLQLLAAAERLFAERGFLAVRLEDIGAEKRAPRQTPPREPRPPRTRRRHAPTPTRDTSPTRQRDGRTTNATPQQQKSRARSRQSGPRFESAAVRSPPWPRGRQAPLSSPSCSCRPWGPGAPGRKRGRRSRPRPAAPRAVDGSARVPPACDAR